MARSVAGTMACHICGKSVSLSGLARTSHLRAHARRGEAVEWEWPGQHGINFARPGESLPAQARIVHYPVKEQ